MPSTAALTLEDRISDPMVPELDPSLLDFRPMDIDFNSKKDDPLDWNSQLLSDPTSVEIGRHAPARAPQAEFDEEYMNIDLGLDLGLDDDPSLEMGLKAPPQDSDDEWTNNDSRLPDDLIGKNKERSISRVPSLIADDGGRDPEDDRIVPDDDGFPIHMDDENNPSPAPFDPRLQRDSQSPLSSLRSSMAREFEATHLNQEDIESPLRQATHKAKRRKVIQADSDTMLSSYQIKQQQADRSAILKPTSFLSQDPMLLNLMNMQKSGGFVSSIMGEGRTDGWAPELRGILSIDSVRKSGELKRKRDSGVADVSENEGSFRVDGIPPLEIPDETLGVVGEDADVHAPFDATIGDTSEVYLPADEGFLPENEDAGVGERQDDEETDSVRDQFDETTAPLLHPSEQGAVSQTTEHAVHLLRDRFGSWAGDSPSQQKKSQILFQDLLPEATTSKADATKMFFEVLVLATKDAVKVEQSDKEVGGALRVRAKRGLWGAWAAREAGGEIAEQEGSGPVAAPP